MTKPDNIKRKSIRLPRIKSFLKGSAMIEAIAGLFILLPVFLLLVDVIALVIAQSINDDLAKQAARYASVCSDANSAYTAASDYVTTSPYATAAKGLVTNAVIQNDAINFNTATGQVQVITQIQCNLPIPVPFGGPASTTFQAQYTVVITGIPPVIPPQAAG